MTTRQTPDRPDSGQRRFTSRLLPPRGRWLWPALGVGILALLCIVFRFHLTAWINAGRNPGRKASTPLGGTNSRDAEFLPGPTQRKDKTVKVAAVQFISEMGKPQLNRQRLEKFVREAAGQGARIVVLPETAITGYMSHDLWTTWQVGSRPLSEGLRGIALDEASEPVPGPSTNAFGELAKELGIYLTIPLVERDPASGKFFNTVTLAGPDGKMLLHYRKLNPWPFAEDGWASSGDRGIQTVDTPYGRLALLICYDINFEPPNLKFRNVDTLLYCIAWVDRPNSAWFHADLPQAARDNDINIIGANWSVPREPDWHGYGHSLIIDRTGRVLARVSRDIGEEIIYAELPVPADGN